MCGSVKELFLLKHMTCICISANRADPKTSILPQSAGHKEF